MNSKDPYAPCEQTRSLAALQDEPTGALVGLARAADTAPAVSDEGWRAMPAAPWRWEPLTQT